MIRTNFLRAMVVTIAAGVLAACDNPSAPSETAVTRASAALQSACPGASGGACEMSVNVVVDGSGAAYLIVRPGSFDAATGVATPAGTLDKVQWKIYNQAGKLVSTSNADADGVEFRQSLGTSVSVGYVVEVIAHIDNHPVKKGRSVVRGTATAMPAPDLSVGAIRVDGAAVETVIADEPVRLTVPFQNSGPGGIAAQCVVMVDGVATGVTFNTPAAAYIAPGSARDCDFTVTLDEGTHAIVVSAVVAAGSFDSDPTNNVATAAIVAEAENDGTPVDLTAGAVRMSVDGTELTGTGSVIRGKTARYTVTFANPGDRSIRFDCSVTASVAGGPATPVALAGSNPIRIPANGTATCTFDYSFALLGQVSFTVSGASSNVADPDLTNNEVEFQTMVKSDNTFPGIQYANVHAIQSWVTDDAGTPTLLNEQSTSISRVTLTFAATSAVIGNFRLSGAILSGADTITRASWTVVGLQPGLGGNSSCVTGVDDGARTVNNHKVTLKVCAKEAAGQPGVQEIFIEFESAKTGGSIANPAPETLFGSNLTFDVKLEWTLSGSTFSGTGYEDHATAQLLFPLEERNTGIPNVHQIEKTGTVIPIRNGPGA